MRWLELLEYTQTKFGEKLTFDVEQDDEFAGSPIWVLYYINAYVDGARAGKLSISFVPKENYETYLPTIFHFAGQEGAVILKDLSPGAKLTDEDINTIVKAYLNEIEWSRSKEEKQAIRDMNINERRKLVSTEIKKYYQKKYAEKRQRFENFHIDKPLVDFIRVEEDFMRRHIGIALYIQGAKWAQERGMYLWASGLQQPAAEKAWDKMDSMGWVSTANGRRYLDYNKITL